MRYPYEQKEINDMEREILNIENEIAGNDKRARKAPVNEAISLFSKNNALEIKKKSLENRLELLVNSDYRKRQNRTYEPDCMFTAKISAL